MLKTRSKSVNVLIAFPSILLLILLIALFYVPNLPYAIIPYVWMGWFLPIEGIILLLPLGGIILSMGLYYLILKNAHARTGALLSSLAEYWWIGMRIYIGISWIMITLFVWTSDFVEYEFPRMIGYMASEGPFPWYNAFLIDMVSPNVRLVSSVIQCTQILIGLCFLLGLLTNFASSIAIFLNMNFLIAVGWADGTGTVVAQNIFLIVHQILFVLLHIGRLAGVDEYLAQKLPRIFLW